MECPTAQIINLQDKSTLMVKKSDHIIIGCAFIKIFQNEAVKGWGNRNLYCLHPYYSWIGSLIDPV